MSQQKQRLSTPEGRHRFTISTKLMRDYGIETPVSGATQIVAARGGQDRLEAYSIGSDQHLHHFSRNGAGRWNRSRMPWKASSLEVVTQRDGTDKVFFSELQGGDDGKVATDEKVVTVYELEQAGHEPQRLLLGRFVTTDPNVYGLSQLSGVQCRDGSNILLTTLATKPSDDSSSWMVLFGQHSSTGALSLDEARGIVADRVKVASEDPGATRWPHMTFVLLEGDQLRVEWGSRQGVLLQSETVPIPQLAHVIEYDVVRDHRGDLKIFALDANHQLHVLCQVAGGGETPPRWARSWHRLDCTQCNGSRPRLRKFHVLRRVDGDLEIFATDDKDQVWSISEDTSAKGRFHGWSRLHSLGIHAAHMVAASPRGNIVEVFAVSRQNQLMWLRRDRQGNWELEKIGWDTLSSPKTELHIYRTGLTIVGESEGDGGVAGIPITITATEHLPSTVNGLSYAIGPAAPVVAQTNAFGRVCVTFEMTEPRSVPSLSFEAGFLGGGQLDVCPQRKAQIFVRGRSDESWDTADTKSRLHLIPEDTVISQS